MKKDGTIYQWSIMASNRSQIAPSSNKRCAIEIYVNSGIGYVTDLPGAAAGDGIPVTPSSPLKFNYEDHGDFVRHSFFGSSLSGTVVFGVVEINEL